MPCCDIIYEFSVLLNGIIGPIYQSNLITIFGPELYRGYIALFISIMLVFLSLVGFLFLSDQQHFTHISALESGFINYHAYCK